MKEQLRKRKGITLIALVITIIVLLILAGVSIATLSGEGGILSKATKAQNNNNQATIVEEVTLAYNTVQMDAIINSWDLNKKAEELQKELRKQDKKSTVIPLENNLIVSYKEYEVTIFDDGKIEVEDPTLGQKPTGKITILTSLETEVDLVEIQVEANTTDGDIETIEAINGAIEKVGVDNTNAKKIFTISKNGIYYFRIKGTNGRTAILQTEEITNIKRTNDLLSEIGRIENAGIQNVKVIGKISEGNFEEKEYQLNVIMHKGDLVLDGEQEVAGVTPVNKVYEFGSQEDVGTADAGAEGYAKNTVVLKVEGNLTINENVTLTSVKSSAGYGGPKGMIIYCTGTLTNKGTITMTQRGAKAEGENIYLWKNANSNFEFVPAAGANGGSNPNNTTYVNGYGGATGTSRRTGGGGAGAHAQGTAGSGTSGTSYSGGTGGGRR